MILYLYSPDDRSSKYVSDKNKIVKSRQNATILRGFQTVWKLGFVCRVKVVKLVRKYQISVEYCSAAVSATFGEITLDE